jgi:biopolymer transport protein ExbD
MAGVSVGAGGRRGRRSLDSEINMIPMIDLLMVTISFLLITAVWVHSQRMTADAQVPGSATAPPCEDCEKEARLHVDARDESKFVLAWKQGSTVVTTVDVPRGGHSRADYAALAAKVEAEWTGAGKHREPNDHRFDQAVVHVGNGMRYGEMVAVMDAVSEPKRAFSAGGKVSRTPAFNVTLAQD